MYFINNDSLFPPVDLTDEEGLLCIGGDLSPERLLLAYRSGIFPWYNEEEPVCWYCPDPRFVLFPGKLKVSKSMQAMLKKKTFEFTINKDFESVIRNCSTINRPGQGGSWIHRDVITAYEAMHRLGHAQSAEVWEEGKLVGGLYGILVNKVFFGESMFSLVSNASKYAFISYVRHLEENGIQVIDCQVYTSHLESLGAEMISRKNFIELLKENI